MQIVATVLIVDDHPGIRLGLAAAFDKQEDFTVTGEAGTMAEAWDALRATPPDVVILDVRLPDGSGMDALPALRQEFPDLGIVIHTAYPEDAQMIQHLDRYASGFVPKSANVGDVLTAARAAVAAPGAFWVRDLSQIFSEKPARPELNERQLKILRLIASGKRISEIADELGVAESTAKTHISNVYQLFDARGSAGLLVLRAVQAGYLDPKDTAY